ncbi:acyl-CoA dehydrogenase [Alteromonas sediminis]|uniref:Acyl-CoA dehydrogenase n=1 Tax=Alteromonas sediminis TaxID=2259342 RepID=A0A3N5Y1J6_9ALTE|nr:acyl-CoA dehydrogenase [Alteromonas sediminis]RPJ67522.1 acyl-CoA dehydrogenase [Alteromonas sediminis]
MSSPLINQFEMPFQLYDVLAVEQLCQHQDFSEHSKETFDAVMDTAEKMATQLFLPHNHVADQNEPTFDGKRITMMQEVKAAFDAYREAGFIAARYPFEEGGMQLPETVNIALSSYFMAANPSSMAYPFLTSAAANLLSHFADDGIKRAFLPKMLSGQYTGTMALTEPHAGSSLADIRTTATKQDDGSYRIKGNKIYISAGDHELADNIVHLVLAKIPGGPAGVKGISLFLVPKFRLNKDGSVGDSNDVALAGLLHKLGYRGTTSTALSFGENNDCHGYLVGEPHCGLKYMFMMMNEARIAVGYGAAMIGYRGYRYSLSYAQERTQGRIAPHDKPNDPPTPIVNHGDVKRMLLAQKAYSEGGIALCLYGANLIDRKRIASDSDEQKDLAELLDLLTPIVKAWPSEYGVKANDIAIQVLGGAGYMREYMAEQFWRDNRLNPIHEGTNGIQALDLTFRKLWQDNGKGLSVLQRELINDLAKVDTPKAAVLVTKLTPYLEKLRVLLEHMAKSMQSASAMTLSGNAQAVMNVMAGIVVSWMWLRQAAIAEKLLAGQHSEEKTNFYLGKLQAAKYFINWELPLIDRDISVLMEDDATCVETREGWL